MVLNLSLSLGPETQSLGLGVGLEVGSLGLGVGLEMGSLGVGLEAWSLGVGLEAGSLGCRSLDYITDEITALSNINDSVRNLRNCRVYCQDVTTAKTNGWLLKSVSHSTM